MSSYDHSDSDLEADIKEKQFTSFVRQHITIAANVIANFEGTVSDFAVSSSISFKDADEAVIVGRKKIKEHTFAPLKFSLLPVILHFDGKIVKEFTNGKEY